jgi:hypothetical protein
MPMLLNLEPIWILLFSPVILSLPHPHFVRLNSSHSVITMTSERTYPLALHAWGTYDNRITVKTTAGDAIAHFPVPFIASGGDNTWRYVLEAVNQLVVLEHRHLGVIKDDVGQILDLDGVPSKGTYLYEQNGVSFR